jgi:preprotein translocase subunit Sec61beta
MIKIKPKTLLAFGAVGFFIVLILNLFSLVVLRQAASIAFEDAWWSIWFPNYVVWLSIFITGIYLSAVR